MELKLIISRLDLITDARFNRTFMELKQFAEATEKAKLERFNRTFMELKHNISTYFTIAFRVLIGPSWN